MRVWVCLVASVCLSCALGCGPARPPQNTVYTGEIDPSSKELADTINAYRRSHNLSEIPISPELTYVAQVHVKDIAANPPSGACNGHSWSAQGPWSSCCYTADHAQAQCMWLKPKELTSYPGLGYEIAALGVYDVNEALEGWKRSPGHHDVILNRGAWAVEWKSMGAAIHPGGAAAVWFGAE